MMLPNAMQCNAIQCNARLCGLQVVFEVAGKVFAAAPPLPLYGAPCGEVPVRPLAEALCVDNLMLVALSGTHCITVCQRFIQLIC
jgi:hypothetical protein